MRIYISGPISAEIPGVPRKERKQRFYACEEWILANRPGWVPVNPLRVEACPDMRCGGSGLSPLGDPTHDHSWECWMRHDLKALLDCDAIVLLPGWVRSAGAAVELNLARHLRMSVLHANVLGEVWA